MGAVGSLSFLLDSLHLLMTITEYLSLSEQDQSVFQLGYSIFDREYLDETLFYDHYTRSYWTQESPKEDPIGPLFFGPKRPSTSSTDSDDILL